MRKLNIIYKIWIILYLFTVLFCPPILPFNTIFITASFALVWLELNGEKSAKLPLNLLFFLIYVIEIILINSLLDSRELVTDNRLRVVYQIFIMMPMQFICAEYVTESTRKKGIQTEGILKILIASGLIEVLFVILAFVNPALRRLFLSSIIKRGGIQRVYANDNVLNYRAYGWADTLLDTFGYGMGSFAGLCLLYKGIGKCRYFYMFLFLFATAVNSRTGFAIFLVAVCIFLISQLRKGNLTAIAKVLLVALSIIIIISISIGMGLIGTSTLSWITTGFESVVNAITGREVAYQVGSLQNSMFNERFWKLPDNLMGFLFGTGHSIFAAGSYLGVSSDVGYVNYIWICGLFGTVFILYIIAKWFGNGIKKTTDPNLKTVRIFLCVSFFLMFIKGNVLTHTAGTFFAILVMTIKNKDAMTVPNIPNS